MLLLHLRIHTVPLSAWGGGGGSLNSQRTGCRDLAIIDPRVLKQAALSSKHCSAPESESSKTGDSVSSLYDSLCLSSVPFTNIRNLQLSVDMPASPREGEGTIREGKQSPSDKRNPSTACLPAWSASLLGFRLPLPFICYFQALERHNTQKLSTYFLILIP